MHALEAGADGHYRGLVNAVLWLVQYDDSLTTHIHSSSDLVLNNHLQRVSSFNWLICAFITQKLSNSLLQDHILMSNIVENTRCISGGKLDGQYSLVSKSSTL